MTAFPMTLRAEVADVAKLIQPDAGIYPGTRVVVQGELLHIPYRIQHECDETLFSRLTPIQADIYACVLTRHLDGRVRQRHIARLAASREPWIAPFIVHLCGEYVIEILAEIEANLPLVDHYVYGAFFRENGAFLKLMRERMISYWDCYYRWIYKRKLEYVGFRVFERFHEWL